jgi:hypothetical protein
MERGYLIQNNPFLGEDEGNMKMKIIGILIMILVIVSGSGYGLQTETTNTTPPFNPIITYPSAISITFNLESVNHPLVREVAYSIAGTIGYKVEVPDWLLNSNFWLLKNWYLFHSSVSPGMIINLSTENVPTWARIYFSSPNIIVAISNEYQTIPINLIVFIHDEAPSGPFTFNATAKTPQIHRIQSSTCTVSITLTVE